MNQGGCRKYVGGCEMRILTASERRALIKLAYKLPVGSGDRRVILARLSKPTRVGGIRSAGVEITMEKSPRLEYGNRLKITDSAAPPPGYGESHFVDRYRRWSQRGKRLKRPVLEERGVTDPGDVAFIDFMGGPADSNIELVIVRPDYRGRGMATKLLREYYKRHTIPGAAVRWGRVLNPTAWSLLEKMKKEFPDRVTMGGRFF